MYIVVPSNLKGRIDALPSVKDAHNILMMSALSDAPTYISNFPNTKDTAVLLSNIRTLGCDFHMKGRELKIYPFKSVEEESMTYFNFFGNFYAAKILFTAGAVLGINMNCDGDPELTEKFFKPLISELQGHGIHLSNNKLPFCVKGKSSGGIYDISGETADSDMLSALLMFLPLAESDSIITAGHAEAETYEIKKLLHRLNSFGIKILKRKNSFYIKGKQKYISPHKITVSNDTCLSSMWACANAADKFSERVDINGLSDHELNICTEYLGCFELLSHKAMTIDVDAGNFEQLVPLLTAICIIKGLRINIKGISAGEYITRRRLELMAKIAKQMCGGMLLTDDGAELYTEEPAVYKSGLKINCGNDPIVFMSMVIAGNLANRPFIIEDSGKSYEAVYPGFLEALESLGGQCIMRE